MRTVKQHKKFLGIVFTVIFAPIVYIIKFSRGNYGNLPEIFHTIMVVELFGIGDFVMACSTYQAIRTKYPHARIVLLTTPKLRSLVCDCPYFDEIIYFDCPWPSQNGYRFDIKKIVSSISQIRNKNVDLAIDLRGDLRNILFMFFAGCRYSVAYGIGFGGFLLTNKIPFNKNIRHQVDQNLNLARFLGAKIESPEPRLLWIKDDKEYLTKLLKSIGHNPQEIIVAVHPGAIWPERRWPVAKFQELTRKLSRILNVKVLLIASSQEVQLIEEIKSAATNVHCVITRDINKLVIVLRQCHMLVCNDSAPMHIATAVGTPVIALFGPQEPALHGPYGNNNVTLRYKVQCSPCIQNVCQRPQNSCMDNIKVGQVYESAVRKIQSVRKEMIDV